jgi:flagellar L-ring protein precursor FlgH
MKRRKNKAMFRTFTLIASACALGACARMDHIGKAPDFTSTMDSREQLAMFNPGLPRHAQEPALLERASLWSGDRESLLGDRRAAKRGDILTVVIELDEEAEISNTTERSRSGSENLGIPDLFGLPQRINRSLPDGASLDQAVGINSSSQSGGDGSVSRSEEITLRVAATVTQVLPNGVLEIQGSQEVRVNFELRELLVNGFVRPEDISRQNEITYDKIAAARISYGGRGQITDVQQPRIGQQVLDAILPF